MCWVALCLGATLEMQAFICSESGSSTGPWFARGLQGGLKGLQGEGNLKGARRGLAGGLKGA